jgi:cytochrome c biogenesis factor
MTFIDFYFWFYILQFISIFYIIVSEHKIKTNKNSIKIIIWLVVGGFIIIIIIYCTLHKSMYIDSDNFQISLSL